MSDDYLWNRTGDPDPETARLESILATLGHRGRPLDLPATQVAPRVPARRPWVRLAWPLAAAATVVLAAGGLWISRMPTPSAWTVEEAVGAPLVGAATAHAGASVPEARWLETDARSRLRLRAGEVGELELGPATRARIVSSQAGDHRLAIERGLLHATIWAAPGQFAVETPSATAVDLGCTYSLEVGADGAGKLRVTSGWVGVERFGRESLVPAGAICELGPGRGPGVPRFEDATQRFVLSVWVFNWETPVFASSPARSLSARNWMLTEARPRDAMTLWHVLVRADRPGRALVYDRLATLSPPPPGITREAVLDGDRAALDAWWNSFGLGDVTLFRKWRLRAGS